MRRRMRKIPPEIGPFTRPSEQFLAIHFPEEGG
jgi:hypothetical protein